LVLRMERPQVFYTYEWALAVYRAYRDSLTPLLLLAYEGDSLVGVAALARDTANDRTIFLAGTTADYCEFLCPRERCAEFTEAVMGELRRLNVVSVTLTVLPSDSATYPALKKAALKHGYATFTRPAFQCAQVVFSSSDRRASILSVVQGNRRQRSLRALTKNGPVVVSHLRAREDIADALPGFAEAHIARFLATGRISNLIRPERRLFLRELAKLLSDSGWMNLSRLLVGGQPIAWNYGFQFAGTWFWYQPTFDSRWQQYSPGIRLLWGIVEEACLTPEISVVDLGLGAEGYKDKIATDERGTLHLEVTRSSVVHLKEAARYLAATSVKSVPRLESMVRAALRQASSIKETIRANTLPTLLGKFWRSGRRAILEKREVFFFEAPQGDSGSTTGLAEDSLKLRPIDYDVLSAAAMYYVEEKDTLAYVLRAADRVRANTSRGFALLNGNGVAVHFCWVADFAGFQMAELQAKLIAPSPQSVLLFDCWSPDSFRGHGYYARAISEVAVQLRAAGKRPWIFSAAVNASSIHGIEKAGFAQSFSLTRRRVLFVNGAVRSESMVPSEPPREVSSAD
jgi:CelD/BcsL family acetyltransferase involved in cellulose biosynthesis